MRTERMVASAIMLAALLFSFLFFINGPVVAQTPDPNAVDPNAQPAADEPKMWADMSTDEKVDALNQGMPGYVAAQIRSKIAGTVEIWGPAMTNMLITDAVAAGYEPAEATARVSTLKATASKGKKAAREAAWASWYNDLSTKAGFLVGKLASWQEANLASQILKAQGFKPADLKVLTDQEKAIVKTAVDQAQQILMIQDTSEQALAILAATTPPPATDPLVPVVNRISALEITVNGREPDPNVQGDKGVVGLVARANTMEAQRDAMEAAWPKLKDGTKDTLAGTTAVGLFVGEKVTELGNSVDEKIANAKKDGLAEGQKAIDKLKGEVDTSLGNKANQADLDKTNGRLIRVEDASAIMGIKIPEVLYTLGLTEKEAKELKNKIKEQAKAAQQAAKRAEAKKGKEVASTGNESPGFF